jgi:hypothetical protein
LHRHASIGLRIAGGKLAIPDVGTNRPDDATDFNDNVMAGKDRRQATGRLSDHTVPGIWVPAILAGTTTLIAGSYFLPNPKVSPPLHFFASVTRVNAADCTG